MKTRPEMRLKVDGIILALEAKRDRDFLEANKTIEEWKEIRREMHIKPRTRKAKEEVKAIPAEPKKPFLPARQKIMEDRGGRSPTLPRVN
jgi:hypothetical protein